VRIVDRSTAEHQRLAPAGAQLAAGPMPSGVCSAVWSDYHPGETALLRALPSLFFMNDHHRAKAYNPVGCADGVPRKRLIGAPGARATRAPSCVPALLYAPTMVP
jgi:hypothetical protein